MHVILLQRVEKLGAMGEVVRVKDGFARNFLLPQGKALRATEANKAKFERDRTDLEASNAERRSGAQGQTGKLDGKSFTVIRQAGESGQLYGSVSTRDIAEAASGSGVAVNRAMVLLQTPIKTLGLHTVRVALHPEVIVSVTVNVARSADEAEAQLRGEKIGDQRDDREEARAAAAALFENEDQTDEADDAQA
jgi:large subunit ribosomal protein L9